jgi:AAA domain
MVAIVNPGVAVRSAPPQFRSICLLADCQREQLPGLPTLVQLSGQWLAAVIEQRLVIYSIKQLSEPRRIFNLSIQPCHLLFAGVDHRYVLVIDHQGAYELWDRVTSAKSAMGGLPLDPKFAATARYQVIGQRHLGMLVGQHLICCAITALDQAVTHTPLPGDIQAIHYHESSDRLYLVYHDPCGDLVLATVALLPDRQLHIHAQYPGWQFVGMSLAANLLFLQVHDRDGQLRLVQFTVPDLVLESSRHKSLAYEGDLAVNPSRPWLLSNLGTGILLSDYSTDMPIGLIEWHQPSPVAFMQWQSPDTCLLVHGTTIEQWVFKPQLQGHSQGFYPETINALTRLRHWLEQSAVNALIGVILGERASGKTDLIQAYATWNQLPVQYANLPSHCTLTMVMQIMANLIGIAPETVAGCTVHDLSMLVMAQENCPGQIILDHAENLMPEVLPILLKQFQTRQFSLVLVTNTALGNAVGDTYYLHPLKQSLDLEQVARFYAPTPQQDRWFLDSVQPLLTAAARQQRDQTPVQ